MFTFPSQRHGERLRESHDESYLRLNHSLAEADTDSDVPCMDFLGCCDTYDNRKLRTSSEWDPEDSEYPRTLEAPSHSFGGFSVDQKYREAFGDPDNANLKFPRADGLAHADLKFRGFVRSSRLRNMLLGLVVVSALLTMAVLAIVNRAAQTMGSHPVQAAIKQTYPLVCNGLCIPVFGFGASSTDLATNSPRLSLTRLIQPLDEDLGRESQTLESALTALQNLKEDPSLENFPVDVLFTWVNGSDAVHRSLRKYYFEKLSPEERLFKDFNGVDTRYRQGPRLTSHNKQFDELAGTLRSAIRSVLQYLARVPGDYMGDAEVPFRVPVEKVVLLTANNLEDKSRWPLMRERPYAQIPNFVDPGSPFFRASNDSRTSSDFANIDNTMPILKVLHHSQVFRNPAILPVFSSLAIETQFVNFSSEQIGRRFVYLNDDMMFGQPHDTSDFFAPDGSPVLSLQDTLTVTPWGDLTPSQQQQLNRENGEWLALYYSSELLTQRFGRRPRAYVTHTWHAFDRTILNDMADETKEPWLAAKLAKAGARRFRNMGPLRGQEHDVHMAFLFSHFVVEKHRELALLFLSHLLDSNGDGKWSQQERGRLIPWLQEQMPATNITDRSVSAPYNQVYYPFESTTSKSQLTGYQWHSDNGILNRDIEYGMTTQNVIESLNGVSRPNTEPATSRICMFSVEYCLPDGWLLDDRGISLEESRKFILDRPHCGDCMLKLLAIAAKNKSQRGLAGWFGEIVDREVSEVRARVAEQESEVDRKTFLKVQRAASLQVLLAEMRRYQYTLSGHYPWNFVTVDGVSSAVRAVADSIKGLPAFMCFNDDLINAGAQDMKKVNQILTEFFAITFPNVAPFEKRSETDNLSSRNPPSEVTCESLGNNGAPGPQNPEDCLRLLRYREYARKWKSDWQFKRALDTAQISYLYQ